jgi:hypothetical protein
MIPSRKETISGASHSAGPASRASSFPSGPIRSVADSDLVEELPDCAGSRPVHRKGDNLESFAAQPLLQACERGHFGATGRAPRRPDIEQHDLAAPVLKGSRLSRLVGEDKIGQGLRLLVQRHHCRSLRVRAAHGREDGKCQRRQDRLHWAFSFSRRLISA